MAIYRLEAKVMSRENRGKSVIAAAAYRAGTKLRDALSDKIYDYSRRIRGVVRSEVLTPETGPEWGRDPEKLWNAVEAGEKRKDAQLAREFILAVPPELDPDAQFRLAAEWAKKELVALGMAAEVSLHHPKTGRNPHVHILTTLRKLEPEGLSPKKSREWNEVGLLHHWRESWADAVNAALEAAGRTERVDHRSLKDRGIDREPEPKVGPEATALQRKGTEAVPRKVEERQFVKTQNDVRPLMRAVQETGEIRLHGMGRTWWERSMRVVSKIRENILGVAKRTWRSIIGKDKGDGPEISH